MNRNSNLLDKKGKNYIALDPVLIVYWRINIY